MTSFGTTHTLVFLDYHTTQFLEELSRVHLSDKVNEAGTKFLIVKEGERNIELFFSSYFSCSGVEEIVAPKT